MSTTWPKVSPFPGLRYRPGPEPEIEVLHNKTWWELFSLNEVPAADILKHARAKFGLEAREKIATSLSEVMGTMDPPVRLGPTVKVELVELRFGEITEFPKVPCNAENHAALMKWKEETSPDWSTPEHEEEPEEEEEVLPGGHPGAVEEEDDDDDDGGARPRGRAGKADAEEGEG
eukprot:RCo008077